MHGQVREGLLQGIQVLGKYQNDQGCYCVLLHMEKDQALRTMEDRIRSRLFWG